MLMNEVGKGLRMLGSQVKWNKITVFLKASFNTLFISTDLDLSVSIAQALVLAVDELNVACGVQKATAKRGICKADDEAWSATVTALLIRA